MRFFAVIPLLLASGGFSFPQAVPPAAVFDRGSLSDHLYTNQSMGITWAIPEDWKAETTSVSSLGDNYQVMLRVFPTGKASNELIELNYAKETDESALRAFLASKSWESTGNSARYTIGGGIPAYRNDYRSKGDPPRYLSVIDGEHRGDITLTLLADSPARIEDLVKATLKINVRPDWRSPEEPPPPSALPRSARVSSGVSQALIEHQVRPTYPEAARQTRIQGPVVMLVHISAEGAVRNLFVMSGHPVLVPAALDAVSQWRYRPYLFNGSPVEVETQITVNFALQ